VLSLRPDPIALTAEMAERGAVHVTKSLRLLPHKLQIVDVQLYRPERPIPRCSNLNGQSLVTTQHLDQPAELASTRLLTARNRRRKYSEKQDAHIFRIERKIAQE